MHNEITRVMLFAYFDGTATAIQIKRIQEWLQQPENREWFYACLEEWENQRLQYEAPIEGGFTHFLQRIDQNDTETQPTIPLLPGRWYQLVTVRWMVAASLTLLLLLAFWQRDSWFYRTYATRFGELKTIGLPDGSHVTLNAHSTLRLSRWTFGRTNREVWLTGEAEFSVRHLSNHQQFIVRTPDNLEVVVLGTKFVVTSRQQGSRIVLTSGKVAFRTAQRTSKSPVIMKPGDVATVSPAGAVQVRSHQPIETYLAWKEHRFLFNRTPLPQVLSTLEEHFGETIQLASPELLQRQITGTFRADTAPVLLELVTTLTRTQVVETDSGKVLIPISSLNP